MTSWVDELVNREDARTAQLVAWAGELEFFGASEDDRQGRTARFRLVRTPEDILKAHPFSKFSRRRGKAAGTIFMMSASVVGSEVPAYSGDVMLLNWTDGPAGATLQLALEQESDSHPFLGFVRPSKQAAGTRLMAAFVEKMDDETPVNQIKAEAAEVAASAPKERKQQRLSNVAALMTKNPRFHEFLSEVCSRVTDEAGADKLLKAICNMDSKRELDAVGPPTEAQNLFNRVRERFVSWQEESGLIDRP